MGPRPREAQRDNNTLKLSEKYVKREHQLGLLNKIKEDSVLLTSNILPSIRPKIGKLFHYKDLNQKAQSVLHHARIRILEECAIPEAQRDTNKLKLGLTRELNRYVDRGRIGKLIDEQNNRLVGSNQKRLDKKVKFHLDKEHLNSNIQLPQNTNKTQRRKKDADRRRAERRKYRTAKTARKVEWMKNHVEQNIKGTLVINLSSEEVPDIAYMYLAKGLNFVENKTVAKEDLLFDAKEFLRKMEWKAHFHQTQGETTEETGETEDLHKDLRIRSRKHPQHFNHPLFDEIRTRLMGFVTNLNPYKPKSNLTNAEQRGKGWILKSIGQQKIFVTNADKGGATLILDYTTVMDTVRSELEKETKFTKLETSVETKMEQTQQKVKDAVLKHHNLNTISEEDKKRITGINDKGNMVHAPELRPEVPYAYPLYKVHKLSLEQIAAKIVPPARLVHATKGGPLYRLEKFVSPFVTKISRKYCEKEFLLDT